MGGSVSLLEAQGPKVLRAGFPEIAHLEIGVAQRDVGLDVSRLQLQRGLERLQRLGILAVRGEGQAQVIIGEEGIERDVRDLPQELDGFPVVPLLVQPHRVRLQLEGGVPGLEGGDG